ncbi:MAG: DUF2190 family protein [Elusimicrobia bacterium]|nr:DUF2190 family protein [Candidatus Obscuribacterium magneticum]
MKSTHRKRKRWLWVLAFLVLAGMAMEEICAEVPDRINFQGKLLYTNKNPKNGTFLMKFRICDTLSESCASPLWTETQESVAVTNGVFSIQLGSVNPISSSVFESASAYLETEIEGETLSPREQLVTSPYAYHANTADDVVSGDSDYIQNRDTLQTGSTFYVQRGTVNGDLTVGGIMTAGSGSNQITTDAGLLDATKLSGILPSANFSGPYTNSVTFSSNTNVFTGNGAGLTNVTAADLVPGNTNYIQNRTSVQTGAAFYVSSATVGGSFTSTGTVALGGVAGTNDVTVTSDLKVNGDIRINGNDIQDSEGTSRLTLGSSILLNGNLSVPSGSANVVVSTSVIFAGATNGDNYIAYPFTAGGTIAAKDIVIISAANNVNVTNAAASPAVVGIAVTGGNAGDTVYVAMSGIVTGVTANGAVVLAAFVCTSAGFGRIDDACNANGAPVGKALTGAAAGGDKITVALFQGR